MTIQASMDCYAARLASFTAAHQPTKKRSSDARSGKTLKWPHKSPAPPQLARAGFYYLPTSSCPDNTTCYLCQSNLDGWEENDDAIEEHLKHAPNCGWAITIAIEQDIENGSYALEDPISEKALNARRMTFGSKWPHENKRGWVCKTQKMIDAGWHYCPTLESDDFVKCSYCNLSLDGWEPKDSPFDEHQRRSPDCSFFTLYASIKAKPARSRKGRASKASRMSTQSNATAVSEGLSAVDTEANPDETVLSTTDLARPNKTARGVKKAPKTKKSTAKAKRKGAKAKQEGSQLASSFVEPEDDDFEVKVQPSPVPAGSSKKRKSEDISEANDKDMRAEPQLPPKKRRTTRASSIAVQSQEVPIAVPQEHNEQETPMSDVEETQPSLAPAPKRGKASKKRSSTRKASTASTASKASLRAAVPNDEEIDAALEAELDRPLTDDEGKGETLEIDEPRTRRLTRNKPGSKKAAASVASTRRGTRATSVAVDEASVLNGYPDISNIEDEQRSPVNVIEEVPTQKASKTSKAKNSKAKASRKVSSQQQTQGKLSENTKDSGPGHDEEDAQGHNPTVEPQQPETRVDFPELSARKTRASQVSNGDTNSPNTRSSVVNTQPTRDDSGHESDTSVISQSRTKHAGKKPSAAVKKIKRGMKPPSIVSHVEEAAQGSADARPIETQNEMTPVAGDDTNHAEPDVMTGKVPEEESKALKASKPSKAKGRPAKAKAVARKAPAVSSPTQPEIVVQTPVEPALPQPQSAHSTPRPALSPQSSDAENQPPSSRPEAIRPPLSMQLPSKNQTIKVPLAATTPDSSPIRGNSSKLQSSFPWTAVDLEQIFHGTPSAGKENDPFFFGGTTNQEILPSPEKKLNVEEWIKFNAQRGEEKLRNECERLVGRFEGEGVRALRTLEGIACVQ